MGILINTLLLPVLLLPIFWLWNFFQKKDFQKRPKGTLEIPGPTPLPIIGNLHQLGAAMHPNFSKMSKKYGPIFKVHIGALTWIVVTDHEIAKDLFVNRGANYSNRPAFGLLTEVILKKNKSMAHAPNNNWWKTIRSIEVQELRQNLINTVYSPIISEETKKFLLHQYSNSMGVIAVNPAPDISTAFTKILATIVFGRTALDSDNIRIYTLLMNTIFKFVNIKGSLLNVFPWLQYFGLRKFLAAEATNIRAEIEEINQELINRVKKRLLVHGEDSENCVIANVMKSVIVDPNFIADPATHQFEKDQDEKYIFDRYDLTTVCLDMMVAGTKTTNTSLIWLYALLAKFPRVQKKIQDELDLVVGKGKFYKIDHKQHLNYLHAVIKESLRFRPPMQFLIPHGNNEEDIYRGYHIPAKSTILINVFSINMDPLLYENPLNFCPERFLDDKGKLKNSNEYCDPWVDLWTRSSILSWNGLSLYTFASYTMSMFTLQLEKDPITGKPIDLDIDTVCGNDFDCKPLDYKLIFKPREEVDVLSALKFTIRSILKKEQGKKIAPYVFKMNDTKILQEYLDKEKITYEIYKEERKIKPNKRALTPTYDEPRKKRKLEEK
ncbi:hypothetical protein G9A89_016267 [Geosiphon pyriformis]|nr:hypothetical protein G9A89_016267 [Geosiphon pyriformis]